MCIYIFFLESSASYKPESQIRHWITPDRNAHFFTPDMIADVIKAIKSSRPDGISSIHLKDFSPRAVKDLTNIFNHSLNNISKPSIWKRGETIVILNFYKLLTEPIFYIPIFSSGTNQKYLRDWFSTTLTPPSPPSYTTRFYTAPLYQHTSHKPKSNHHSMIK